MKPHYMLHVIIEVETMRKFLRNLQGIKHLNMSKSNISVSNLLQRSILTESLITEAERTTLTGDDRYCEL